MSVRTGMGGSGPKVFGGHLQTGRQRRGLMRPAWQVATTGTPSSDTWDEVARRETIERRRREIEDELDRRPYD